MADEIKIKISADGAAQTTAQVDKLVKSLERQAKTQEMIGKTQEQLKRQNVIDELKKQAAQVNGLSNALDGATGSLGHANNGLSTFGSNTQLLRSKLSPAAALIGNLSSQLSVLAPEATGAAKGLQVAAMAGSQFLGVLGGGPGIIIGGAIAAVGALAAIMSTAKKEADDLAKSTMDNAVALNSYISSVDDLRGKVGGKRTQMDDAQSREERLYGGKGTLGELTDEIALNDLLISQNRNAAKPISTDMGWDEMKQRAGVRQAALDEIKDLEERNARLKALMPDAANAEAWQKTNAEALKTFEIAKEGVLLEERPKGKQDRPELSLSDSNAYLMEQVGSFNTTDQVMFDQRGADKAAKDEFDKKALAADEYRQNERDKENSTQELITNDKGTWLDTQFQLVAEHEAKILAIKAQTRAAEMASVQMVTGATLKGISEVAKGKKLELGGILEGLGDQFVAAGTGLIFTGLGISANPITPGAGAGMVSIGTAEVAFGLGLGAAGARMPGGSNASGGASTSKPDSGFGAPSSDPNRNSFTPDEAEPKVINIYMTSTLSPSAEDGLRMKQAADAAFNVYGSAAVPNHAQR